MYIHTPGRVGKAGREQVASQRALLSELQLLSPYPRAAKTSRSKGVQKESTALIQYRKIAITLVLSSFFQENNNRRQKKKTKKKKKKNPKIRLWHQELACQGGKHTQWGRRLVFPD